MESKNSKVRRLVSCGEYKQALQICKDWNYENPEHRSILQRGYECILYPGFYEQLGYNPSTVIEEAIQILHKVYK